ncbi:hypothetical protein PpBr36_00080 [Pyricularia pennisetigena]|uniref:hypothetical protein n=1 Tax=Pyricularia pennisetigena TaxID=1578925 RepID=UPI00114F0BD5|nr:hypothetical protein PpBr36_00080 [Pyricularia pennisetigena]TLS29033.1 hypothetical protein PpBr36_00080 [Pyricularia pennisetigena]
MPANYPNRNRGYELLDDRLCFLFSARGSILSTLVPIRSLINTPVTSTTRPPSCPINLGTGHFFHPECRQLLRTPPGCTPGYAEALLIYGLRVVAESTSRVSTPATARALLLWLDGRCFD